MGSATPEKVVLGGVRTQGEQAMRIGQLSSLSLLQFLPLGSYPDLLQRWTCDMEV